MANPVLHELAHHVPGYIAGPGGEDVLFSFLSVFLLVTVTLIGVVYFKLHALPEKMAHNENHVQFQLVGVLSLLALFTHNNIFWIAALLLAAARLPDFTAPLQAIADSVRELARSKAAVSQTEKTSAGTPSEPPPQPGAGLPTGADAPEIKPEVSRA
ncbi:MAG: hypothetical protein NXI18_16045 [Alphaproteobacteria bacterium]|nr:hypothetical protein [Alphaproteobacteria bacterium]